VVNSSNLSSTPATISATRPSANGSPNIFTSASAPASNLQNINDPTITSTGGVELGVKFRSDVAGTITGVRFYKGSLAAGTQTGELWSSAGQLLATATFTNESASGWQQVSFANPVSIAANTTYIVSYHTTAPYLAYTPNTFSAAGIDNNPLHALANGVDGNNGVYHYDTTPGVSSFPNLYNGQAPNYWVDVVFGTTAIVGPSAPSAPAGLTATAPSSTQVTLGWTASTGTVTAYHVERSTNGGAFVEIAGNVQTVGYTDNTVQANTAYTYQVRAENSGAFSAYSNTQQVSTPLAATSIFASSSAPAAGLQNINDPSIPGSGGVELGVKFRSDVSGTITGVRFWKGSLNTGTHTGELWSSTGQLLATATFTNESASGWQQVTFSTPVTIAANTTYIVSYHTTAAYIAYGPSQFASGGVDNAPLHALANGVDGNNGIYKYGPSGFPSVYNGQAPSYWVDVVFNPSGQTTPVAPSAPTALAATPTAGGPVSLSWTASTGTVTAYHVERSTNGGAFVEIAAGVQGTTYTDSAVQSGTSYTYQVRAENSGVFSGYSNAQQVTTAAAVATSSIFSSASGPTAGFQNVNDNSIPGAGGVELGVKFRSDVSGTITGVRFWKGSLNTGTHTGELWSSTGQLLATATFTNESASGWQQVTFSNPVAIAANTTYIVSYHTNAAYLAYTPSTFASSGVDNGTLHALGNGVDGNNSVYKYGASSFPTVYNGQAPNYWVDVVFAATPAPLTLTSLDIGASPAGSTTVVTPGVDYNVSAGGPAIYGNSDGFRFVYEQLTGNFDIAVQVQSMTVAGATAQAGLMARTSLDAASQEVSVTTSPSSGYRFKDRDTTGGITNFTTVNGPTVYPNVWVRLQRAGNVFTGYYSTDGINWTLTGTVNLALPNTLYVGLAAASNNTTDLTTVQFRGFGNTAS
jgi:regulation of enolase protein 1 (concanavalin A-like superfamily)